MTSQEFRPPARVRTSAGLLYLLTYRPLGMKTSGPRPSGGNRAETSWSELKGELLNLLFLPFPFPGCTNESLCRCIPQWLPPLFSARTRCEGMNETSLIQEDISIWVQVITSEGRWLASRFCKQFYFFNYLFVHISFTAFFTPSTLLHEIVAEFKPK